MPEYTPNTEERNHRNALLLGGVVCLLVAWAIWRGPDRAQAPAFYYPEPTPQIIDAHTEVHIFSDNDICIGACR